MPEILCPTGADIATWTSLDIADAVVTTGVTIDSICITGDTGNGGDTCSTGDLVGTPITGDAKPVQSLPRKEAGKKPLTFSETLKMFQDDGAGAKRQSPKESPIPLLHQDHGNRFKLLPYQDDQRNSAVKIVNNPNVTSIPERKQVYESKHFSKFFATAFHSMREHERREAEKQDNRSSGQEKLDQVAVMNKIYGVFKNPVLILLEDTPLSIADIAILQNCWKPYTPTRMTSTRRHSSMLSARFWVLGGSAEPGVRRKYYWPATKTAVSNMRDLAKNSHNFKGNTAATLGVIRLKGCYDTYDKIPLNRIPTARGSESPVPLENFYKIVNVLGVYRQDFSLWLSNHIPRSSFQEDHGFGWDGIPLMNDKDEAIKEWNDELQSALEEDDRVSFRVVYLQGKENPILSFHDNVAQLVGKTLFQPYVMRPLKNVGGVRNGTWTVNSMVLDCRADGWKCIGGIRGAGLIPDDSGV
ncbi:hypothetical protein BDD12DRAFT_910671 [Trichophaea hybrida]|nr:hypothetical protein BDD12DRAFT_910671 [Trichophaea hybrida]